MTSNSGKSLYSSVGGFLRTESGNQLAPETTRRMFRDPDFRAHMKDNGLTPQDLRKISKGGQIPTSKEERFVRGVQSFFKANPNRVYTLEGGTRVQLSTQGARLFPKTFVRQAKEAAAAAETSKQPGGLSKEEQKKLAQDRLDRERTIVANIARLRAGEKVWGPLSENAAPGIKEKTEILEKVLHPEKDKEGKTTGTSVAARPTSPVEFSGAGAGYLRTVDRTNELPPAVPIAAPSSTPASETGSTEDSKSSDPPPAATDEPEIG